ncbi:hypothetical protein TUMSATVNIG1_61400 (plasmid) [Vibrio nigripulchritudo]|nr:hypothetical protein VNTUMSATTG_60930 [Vibrio nigripulchritudo]BDU35531.1 hypothetical protein TUMSATVNIG1_61400 [Vibrio nigripulchritudo]
MTYSEIEQKLNLQRASVRRLVGEFKTAGVIAEEKCNHSKRYVEVVASPACTLSSNNAAEHCNEARPQSPGWKLASSYNARVDPVTDDFLSVSDSKVVSALFDYYPFANQLKFCFADILPTERKGQHECDLQIEANDSTSIVLESEIGEVITISEIQFIYTIINLTLRYYIDVRKNYNSAINPNITPLKTSNILTFLGLDPNASANKRMVQEKLKLLANTKFGLLGRFVGFDEIATKPLFSIRGSRSHDYKDHNCVPYKYLVEWDTSVLKALFLSKMYYLLPAELVKSDSRIFLLYLYARRLFSYTTSIELTSDKLRQVLSIPSSMDMVAMERSLRKLFTKNADPGDITIEKTGRFIDTIDIVVLKGGIKMSLHIDKTRRGSWPEIKVVASWVPVHVLVQSQPPALRSSIVIDQALQTVSEDSLHLLEGKSKTHPTIHGNALNLGRFADEIDNQASQIQDELTAALDFGIFARPDSIESQKSMLATIEASDSEFFGSSAWSSEEQENKIPVKILKRKHMIDIRFGTRNPVKVSRYMSPERLDSVIRQIALATSNPFDVLLKRVNKSLESTELVSLAGEELIIDDFRQLVVLVRSRLQGTSPIQFSEELVLEEVIQFVRIDKRRATTAYSGINELSDTIAQVLISKNH